MPNYQRARPPARRIDTRYLYTIAVRKSTSHFGPPAATSRHIPLPHTPSQGYFRCKLVATAANRGEFEVIGAVTMAGVINGVGKAWMRRAGELPLKPRRRTRLTRPAAGRDNGGASRSAYGWSADDPLVAMQRGRPRASKPGRIGRNFVSSLKPTGGRTNSWLQLPLRRHRLGSIGRKLAA